jgi:EmrB/QacA subfamily drug resistance transporter
MNRVYSSEVTADDASRIQAVDASVPAGVTSRHRRILAAAVLMIGALTDMIDVSIVNVALPTIGRRLGAGGTALEWIVSAYMLGFAAVLIVAGRLGDRFGRRRLFVLGTAGFGVASLVAGLSSSPNLLIAARAMQGVSAGIMTPQVLATFREIFPRSQRGAIFGVYGAVLGLASAVGVAMGGVLVSPSALGLGWRSIFLINVPIAAVAVVAALIVVPETVDPRARRPDGVAAVGFMAGVVAVVFALLEGRRMQWPVWIFVMLAGGTLALLLAVQRGRRERPQTAAVIPTSLLGHRAAGCGLTTQLVFSAGLQGLMLTFALFLQVGQHASALRAGLTLLAFSAGGVLTAPQAAALAERHGRRILAVGALMLTAGVAGMIWGAHQLAGGPGPWPLVPGLVIAGAGLGLLVVPLVNVVLAAVPAADAGGASGVFSTAQQLGGALGVAIVGTVFFAHSGGVPSLGAFQTAAIIAAAGFALCGLLTFGLPRNALSEKDVLELETT